MVTTEEIRHIEVTENILFIVVESLDVPSEKHTHLHSARCLDTSERFVWVNFSRPSLITRCQQFKIVPVSLDFRVEGDWLKCAAPQT